MPEVKPSASTQQHLDIYDIKDDIVILKNGGATAVLKTGAVNFDLLSQNEQDAAISAYAGLLNSLNFPMQITIRSNKMDITDYLRKVEQAKENIEDNELLKKATENYQNFIGNLVSNFEILDKEFYVAVTYTEEGIKTTSSPFSWIQELLGLQFQKKEELDVDSIIEKAKPQLNPKVDHLIKEFRRINISAKRLDTQELVKLYFNIYNAESGTKKTLETDVGDYKSEIVETLK